jgi:ribonuclease D
MGLSPEPSKPSRRHPMPYRSVHRQRSHESAHAEHSHGVAEAQIDHPLVPKGPPAVIKDAGQLDDLISHLREVGQFGYDSEFIGELTYVPRLCLIQVASAGRITLVDPLSGLDLRPFWELIVDGRIEKIVHAGQQDLEPIVRELGKAPANVFDTQIASGFVRLPYPLSLSKLVLEMTGVKLGKGLTFTHWDQRPLSAMQLRYAADDVRYLLLARQEIGRRLDAAGHAEWAAAECAEQCDPKIFEFDPEQQYLRVRGAGALARRNLAVLREMTIWRDAAARTANVPPRAFLRDEILLDLARNPVRSVEKLARVKGLPRPVESQYGSQLVQMTEKAFSLAEEELPPVRDTEQPPPEKFRTDALWAVAQSLCAGQGIDVAVATSRQEINEFYQYLTSADETSTPHRLLNGWRRQAIGDALRQLIQGAGNIAIDWQEGGLRASFNSR